MKRPFLFVATTFALLSLLVAGGWWGLQYRTGRYQYSKAMDYFQGRNGRREPEAAEKWFRKAALHNHAEAMAQLGRMHLHGLGIKPVFSEGFEWSKRSADLGNPRGMFHLAEAYERGLGVTLNFELAGRWFQKSMESGFPDALFECTERPDLGLRKNYEQQLSRMGNGLFYPFTLAEMYRTGRGRILNIEKGNLELGAAADDGDLFALDRLASVNILNGKNIERAINILKSAHEKGWVDAANQLGFVYWSGLNDVHGEKQFDEAIKWFRLGRNEKALEACIREKQENSKPRIVINNFELGLSEYGSKRILGNAVNVSSKSAQIVTLYYTLYDYSGATCDKERYTIPGIQAGENWTLNIPCSPRAERVQLTRIEVY